MADPMDIVEVPGYPGMWNRRCMVEGWVAAGSPPLDGGGRTYEKQKWYYQRWLDGTGNAADNPDADTRQPHVRGMAWDLRVWNADVVRRMEAAGFIRPITRRRGYPWPDGLGGFSQDEGWHFELRKYVYSIKNIPKVTAAVAGHAIPFEEDDMPTAEEIAQAVWNTKIRYGTGDKAAIQALADVPTSVWAVPVNRSSGPVKALQELADAKSLMIAQQGQIAALTKLVEQLGGGGTVDMAAITAAAEKGAREALSGLTLTATVDSE